MAKNEEMFKEAIAEAKAIKAMAIANAKAALEEAFTPQLTTMFSAKIREMEEEDEAELCEDDDINLDEVLNEVEEEDEESEEEEAEESTEDEEKEDNSLDIEDMTEDDLAKLIEDIMLEEFPQLAQFKSEESEESEDEDAELDLEDDLEDEDINLDEILNEVEDEDLDEVNLDEMLSEMEDEDEDETPVYETLSFELDEAKNTIESLRAERDELMNEVKEVNMLNAKLLYTNKIFKSKNLNESQKIKVLGAFDKTSSVKEVKLVYETLLESLKVKTPTTNQVAGRASKSTITPSKPTQIIESNEQYLRMQKLAGII